MIELDDVAVRYPGSGHPALDGVSLLIERGEFVFVTGASGAGKSTLLKLLYGAERPSRGDVRIEGRSIPQLDPRSIPYLRRNLGVVFQDFALLPRRTVWDNVALALEVCSVPRRDIARRVPLALERVGLGGLGGRKAGELSGGEQQRAAIARAIVNDPILVLADEPTGNLDRERGDAIVSLLRTLRAERGTTVLMATHDVERIEPGSRVVTLESGKVRSDGPHRPTAGLAEVADGPDEGEGVTTFRQSSPPGGRQVATGVDAPPEPGALAAPADDPSAAAGPSSAEAPASQAESGPAPTSQPPVARPHAPRTRSRRR